MPKITAVIRPKKDAIGQVPIYIRISDKGKTRYMSTGLKIKDKYWNKKDGLVRENDYYEASSMNKIIRDKIKDANDEFYYLRAEGQYVNAEIIKKRTQNKNVNGDFIAFAKQFAKRKRQQNLRTGDKYDSIITKIEGYTGGTLNFRELTVTWLKEYSDYLAVKKGNSQNTIHSNMRCIRAILYDAIREGQFPQAKNPFFLMKLKQPKVDRVKLNEKELKSILKLKVKREPDKSLAKDTYLFSFFSCGMRFSDVCLLRWKNIEDDHISYRMNKTRSQQTVALVPQAKQILRQYSKSKNEPNDFVFPLLDPKRDLSNEETLDNNISSANATINKILKKVAEDAKIYKLISFHTARHTYADLARKKGMDLYSLSKSLAHSSLKVTENYLKKLDNETTDKAVKKIFKDL